jgi:Alpha-kinase family
LLPGHLEYTSPFLVKAVSFSEDLTTNKKEVLSTMYFETEEFMTGRFIIFNRPWGEENKERIEGKGYIHLP